MYLSNLIYQFSVAMESYYAYLRIICICILVCYVCTEAVITTDQDCSVKSSRELCLFYFI